MVAYSFKKRFVTPIRIGLGLPIRPQDADSEGCTMLTPKLQTIRGVGKRRHALVCERLQLYTAQRTRQCELIGTAECNSVSPIYIQVHEDKELRFRINDKWLNDRKAEKFCRADGFASMEDMWLFWRREHAGIVDFGGLVIGWKP